MLAELYVGGIVVAGISHLTQDFRKEWRYKKEITDKWNKLIDAYGTKGQNKIEQKFELLKIIKKEYGFNAIVSMPLASSLNDIRGLIGAIELAYGANVIVELAENSTSVFMRVHYKSYKISDKDRIRFKWYKVFGAKNLRSELGVTYTIKKIEDILNPNTKEIIGYKLSIKIPEGLNFDKLLESEEAISSSIGKCFIEWNMKKRCAEVQIIVNPLSREEKFTPIEVAPYQIYVGMKYNYEPVLLDYKTVPNTLVGGMPGTGKTVSLIMGFLNLCYWNNKDKVRLYIGLISEKQDFRVFKNLEQTDYYAKTLKGSVKLMRYLVNEAVRRNKLFDNHRNFITNVYEYNRDVQEQLPLLYFLTDEIANYMPLSTDKESDKALKEEFISLFWKLSREGRSAGIYLNVATQRGDIKNMDSNIKANLANKICFKQSNIASAGTILGIGDKIASKVTRLDSKERECLIECAEGLVLAKTLYLDTTMMQTYLKDKVVKDKEYLNISDRGIIEEKIIQIEEAVEKKKGPRYLEFKKKVN